MDALIISLINKFGYLAVFLLITIENVFPPIPSEVILTFSGFLTTYTNLNVILVIVSSVLGSMVGAYILYYAGKILNKERMKKLVRGKIGKILRLKETDIEKADNWFDTKGNKSVFFCRFVPVVRSLISIPAGMSEMPIAKFSLYTFTGSLMWNTILILVGAKLKDSWSLAIDIIDKYKYFVIGIFILILIFLMLKYILKKKQGAKDGKRL